ncbi:MAG TPA: OmpA family protein [Polyangiales bacterium]|nr:OmpA family protein [Polyangiales bacterium]
MMVSADQTSWLAYEDPGLLFDVQLGYGLSHWLDLQVGTSAGVFFSDLDNGGLASPMLGLLARWSNPSAAPFAALDFGGAFTGSLLLPMLRASVGVELPVSEDFSFGPTLGYSSVINTNHPGDSTDARYVWLGLTLLWARTLPRPVQRTAAAPPAPAPPPRVVEVRGPSTELLQLVDRAVPGRTDQVELLAPVLFGFDSDVLEPVGVAMLHEVAHELAARPELALIEIRAYADARGSNAYNRALAERRGQRVRDWLIEHGVAADRLVIAPLGAAEPVEAGEAESAHEQNRRVVFRVLNVREAP